ncbi:hypothetical protein Tco_0313085 [Tanacetum coccineum]
MVVLFALLWSLRNLTCACTEVWLPVLQKFIEELQKTRLKDVASFLAAATEEKKKRGHVLSYLTMEESKLLKDTQLPQTSVPIPNVADEAVFKEWDDRVVKGTTTAASLDAVQASGNITNTPTTINTKLRLPQGIGVAKVLADAAKKNVNTYTRRRRVISTGSGEQEQDRLGHEVAVRLQEGLDEEERQRMARVHAAA